MNRTAAFPAIFLAFLTTAAMAQTRDWSLGVIGGLAPVSGFPNTTIARPGPPTQYTQFSSDGADYVVGASAEVRLPHSFSLEIDGLYRSLNFKAATSSVLPVNSLRNTVLSWTMPVLLKRRVWTSTLASKGISPLLEAGPSFRWSGNRNDTALSNRGLTGGAGLEWKVSRFGITPTVRYTRWAEDKPATPYIPRSRQGQVEILTGFSF